MPLDFRNLNALWGSILVETLHRLGLTKAVICPGSRSSPLAVAFATHPQIEAIPVLDERSAAFFALGMSKISGVATALVCTSGTAGANFYPAIIEARESGIPLLILSADRPPELRHCHAGQAIDQLKLYGNYPNWQSELALPQAELLSYLRQVMVQAVERTYLPYKGVVHLNVPFRDPLAPIPDANQLHLNEEQFFSHLSERGTGKDIDRCELPTENSEFSIIIAGVAQPTNPRLYCEVVGRLSRSLGWPVLAEGLSPLRNYAELNPYLISTYDTILRCPKLAEKLAPQQVLQLGALPTSKELRQWLEQCNPRRWIVDERAENFDPLHGATQHLPIAVEQLANLSLLDSPDRPSPYLQRWLTAEDRVREAIARAMADESTCEGKFEGKIAWMLSQVLPEETPLIIANSMPVRDVEFFWQPNRRHIRPFGNRGANGIDGTLSTALGVAHRQPSSVLLTGDLALLHDTNGFLLRDRFIGHLTIVLINNHGGGIFEMLPISQFEPPFEGFFATPQNVDFSRLGATYDLEYRRVECWQQLKSLLNPLPATGIRLLEWQSDRRRDAAWRQTHFTRWAEALSGS